MKGGPQGHRGKSEPELVLYILLLWVRRLGGDHFDNQQGMKIDECGTLAKTNFDYSVEEQLRWKR